MLVMHMDTTMDTSYITSYSYITITSYAYGHYRIIADQDDYINIM